jgi:hypothetical protein
MDEALQGLLRAPHSERNSKSKSAGTETPSLGLSSFDLRILCFPAEHRTEGVLGNEYFPPTHGNTED